MRKVIEIGIVVIEIENIGFTELRTGNGSISRFFLQDTNIPGHKLPIYRLIQSAAKSMFRVDFFHTIFNVFCIYEAETESVILLRMRRLGAWEATGTMKRSEDRGL